MAAQCTACLPGGYSVWVLPVLATVWGLVGVLLVALGVRVRRERRLAPRRRRRIKPGRPQHGRPGPGTSVAEIQHRLFREAIPRSGPPHRRPRIVGIVPRTAEPKAGPDTEPVRPTG